MHTYTSCLHTCIRAYTQTRSHPHTPHTFTHHTLMHAQTHAHTTCTCAHTCSPHTHAHHTRAHTSHQAHTHTHTQTCACTHTHIHALPLPGLNFTVLQCPVPPCPPGGFLVPATFLGPHCIRQPSDPRKPLQRLPVGPADTRVPSPALPTEPCGSEPHLTVPSGRWRVI